MVLFFYMESLEGCSWIKCWLLALCPLPVRRIAGGARPLRILRAERALPERRRHAGHVPRGRLYRGKHPRPIDWGFRGFSK